MSINVLRSYLQIVAGSIIYALGIVIFIFPHSLLLGGTSGISVILDRYLEALSPGSILVFINCALIVIAFIVLGKSMAVKSLVGSILTTFFVGGFERIFTLEMPIEYWYSVADYRFPDCGHWWSHIRNNYWGKLNDWSYNKNIWD